MVTKEKEFKAEEVLHASGSLMTHVDCPACKETFFMEGRIDDVLVNCHYCERPLLVRLV